MAEALKFTGLNEASLVYPELPWKASGDTVWIWDEKKEDYVLVEEGNFIVHIGNRYEVSEEEPEKAKPVEVPTDDKK